MCRKAWCLGGVLDITLHVLGAASRGEPTEQALCFGLARRADVSVAAIITLDRARTMATVTAWPHTVDIVRVGVLVERLPQAFPLLMQHLLGEKRALCLSRDAGASGWHGTLAALLVNEVLGCRDIAEMPLDGSPEFVRLAVVAGPARYDDRAIHVFESLREPLVAIAGLLDRVDASARHGDGADPGLTAREVEVLRMLADGLLARTMAARLGVSPRTIHKHLGNVYRKLDAHDRLVAVRRAERLGLLEVAREPGGNGGRLSAGGAAAVRW